MKGRISYVTVARGFGYLVLRDEHNMLHKFFFPTKNIIASEVNIEDLKPGLIAEFDVMQAPQPDKLPVATNIRITQPSGEVRYLEPETKKGQAGLGAIKAVEHD